VSSLIQQRGELTWLGTDAGHLILMPRALRPRWSGIEPPIDGRVVEALFRWNQPTDAACDYDRACDVQDYVGILDVDSGSAIVLGQDPLPATWQALPGGGVVIARLYTSEVGTPSSLPPLSPLAWHEVGLIECDDSPLVLFDSTEVGWEEPVFPSLELKIAAGRYGVAHAKLATDKMELWLVRLHPV
jgi:hypothetical protein